MVQEEGEKFPGKVAAPSPYAGPLRGGTGGTSFPGPRGPRLRGPRRITHFAREKITYDQTCAKCFIYLRSSGFYNLFK